MIFQGKRILVTGGTGSFGQVFIRRILSGVEGTPAKVIVMSRDEAKQHDMRVSYSTRKALTDEISYKNFLNVLEFRIGDVRNFSDVCSAVKNVDIVINAAALKQVPSCEYFPHQAFDTNCVGASNIVKAIEENGYPVHTVVGVSTDKACKPVNVMGMTKSLQERIFIAANVLNPKTRFICVRYGNVLASRGSVIPLFHEQIRHGGPVTITVPDMTRFLLSLNQASDTVIAALKDARRGETFVPIAPAANVINIAKALIGDRPIEIKTIGIRPGEKMHEIMISDEEAMRVIRRGQYYAIQSLLPELWDGEKPTEGLLKKEFSSADSVLNFDETVALLNQHKLMIGQVDFSIKEEILR